jgi:lipoprotein-releasing system permease protein
VISRSDVAYSFQIGLRYLRSKKRATVSMITIISIVGVSLGVAALLSVLAITTGFERAFRDKVLGVNAHVLVLKYGREFEDYRRVLETSKAMPEVSGAAPFSINEMMLTKGDRRAVVLVKGVTPEGIRDVLDVPNQMIEGQLEGLRRPGAQPYRGEASKADDEWQWLDALRAELDSPSEPAQAAERDHRAPAPRPTGWDASRPEDTAPTRPVTAVASPEDVESLLDELPDEQFELPDDDSWEAALVAAGDEEGAERSPGIVIGKTLAADLGLALGDRVTLISPLATLDLSMADAGTSATRSRDFEVIGIFEAGFQEYDSRLVYTDLFEAQRLYEDGDNVTGVELRVHDLDKSALVARELEGELGGAFHTLDWSELNRNLFTALEVQKIVLTLVIATIIFVAAFNVIATLIMIVIEKKREIAILKAMGATDMTVLGVFMVQGVVIGIVGTLIGVIVGGGVVAYLAKIRFPLDPKVYLIDHLPVVINPTVFVLTIAIALAICTVSTIAPSWWAARMLPVEGLRYE